MGLPRTAFFATTFPVRTHSDRAYVRRAVTLSIVAWATLTSTTAVTGEYPERPVRLIVPSAPGGGADVTTRIIAAELTRQMGKQVVVDNRAGATGLIGTELIARAPPDGYTFGQGNTNTLAVNRILMPKLPYDPDRDIQPISQYGVGRNILAVTLSLPVNSVQDLIDHARRNPGKLTFASGGNGSSLHLAGELFKLMTRTQITHVPYKAVQHGIADMIGGQIHLMFDNASSIGTHVRAGRVRGLAITSARRSSSWPELPTVAESGVPGFDVTSWGGFVAPSGVAKVIIDRLNVEVNRALTTSAVTDKFDVFGTEPTGGSPAEFDALIKREVAKWTALVRDASIKLD